MLKTQNSKQYDLEERTLLFATDIRNFTKKLHRNIHNAEYIKQLTRSSASIGANYIEANEALSKKDFLMRIKISRKEAKESVFWLKLVDTENNGQSEKDRLVLIKESTELMMILSSIMRKST